MRSDGFMYVELIVTVSLIVFLISSALLLSGHIMAKSEQQSDELVLQQEAGALQFLLLNEMKQGSRFRLLNENVLLFDLDAERTVRIRHQSKQLSREIQKGKGPFEGFVLLSRYVEQVKFTVDDAGHGVSMQLHFAKGDAEFSLRTHWHERVRREGD